MRSRDLPRILGQWKDVWSVYDGWHWSWSDSKVCFCVFGSFTARCMLYVTGFWKNDPNRTFIRSFEINGFKEFKSA